MRIARAAALLVTMICTARGAIAQVTPAAGYTPPDDTPSIRLGMTLFPTYTVQTEPNVTDADGNSVNRSAFDVQRAYINITGNISHLVAFRITPDITRQSGLLSLGPGNSVPNDSLVFRIKYAYAQFNLDDWMARGSWVRLGIQQTPWVDFEEGIYRYRFQGTVFAERIPLPTAMTSADAGVSFHYNLPSNYGDIHVGVYNGENYQRVEPNDQKALEFRGTLRPFALGLPVLRGVRAHFVYYNDHYAGDDERKRLMGNVTFEHHYVNAGFDYLDAKDQTLAHRARRREPRLLDLGDSSTSARPGRVLGNAGPVRSLDAESLQRHRARGRHRGTRGFRSAPRSKIERSLACRTGFLTRET